MADAIQTGAGNQPPASVDGNAGSANAPGAGERSSAMMQRPDWVPEKFFKDGVIDYKGMATSYSELEKKQGGAPASKPDANAQAPASKPDANQAPAPNIPGIAQDRMTHFTNEMTKDGKLSDQSYEELAKVGYPKPVVDAFIRGQRADAEIEQAKLADKQIAEIKGSVGGDENLSQMLQWAKANWSQADQKVYNDAVASGDVAKVKMAVNGLKAAYDEANGTDPNYINLGGHRAPVLPGVEPFRSDTEVVDAMRDPRYNRSESYRQEVARRLAVSDVFMQSRDVTKVSRS